MYEICNLVNLEIDTITNNSTVNFGNTRNLGDIFLTKDQGGSEAIGDFSLSFSADQNYSLSCNLDDMGQTENTTTSASTSARQMKQKIFNIVSGKKTRSYTTKKK